MPCQNSVSGCSGKFQLQREHWWPPVVGFVFFLHGFSSWTLFGKHGEFCAAKSVPMLWLDGWGIVRYCKILQTIRLRSGWQHDNDFARTSSAVLQSPCSCKADSAKWFTKPFVAPQYVYLPNCTWMDLEVWRLYISLMHAHAMFEGVRIRWT